VRTGRRRGRRHGLILLVSLVLGAGIAAPGSAALASTGVGQSAAVPARLSAGSGSRTASPPAGVGAGVPASSPAATGAWSAVMNWGLQAKHMAALPNGNVLVWSTGSNAAVWNPAGNTFTAAPALFGDLHCAGESMLADGRVIVVGGQNVSPHNGTSVTSIYDPFSGTWTQGADMAYLRWYATSTTLADGRVLASSGDAPDGSRATIPEVYDPVANTWTKLTGAPRSQALYPLMFVLPDGRVFEAGPGTATAILDPSGTGSWAPGPTNAWATNGYSESAVMYAPGKIMRAGGGDPATNHVAVIDMNAANPVWRTVAPMAFARRRMNLTILADGSVMAIGGTAAADDASQAVLPAEIWDPTTETWTTVDPMAEPRMYHSSAVLLPDGRIVVGGGEAAGRLDAQLYAPPYLFKGSRPVIAAAPGTAVYGGTFAVTTPDAASITSVALIRLDAATHAFDQNQRYVPLSFSAAAGSLTVNGPPSGGVAPPGFYQLVIENGAGVPSVASMIRIDSGANLQPGSIAGTITDQASGLPITGATVSVGAQTTTSGPDGTYSLVGIPAGERTVIAGAPGYAGATRDQSVVAGGAYRVDIALGAPGSLIGHVTDAATGQPVAGAAITYPGGETTTDASGAYSTAAISAGLQQVAASAAGYVTTQQNASVAAGVATTLDFALVQAPTFITGTVTDVVTGQPLVGATITLTGGSTTTTDALGRYRFDVTAGTYSVTAAAAGYVTDQHDSIVSTGTYAVTDFGLAVTPPTTSTLSFVAGADAYVNQGNVTKNYGTDSTIRIRAGTTASPGTYVGYLRFVVTGLAGRSITAARVRLFTTDGSPDGGRLVAAGDAWTETGITWANAPATTGSPGPGAGPVVAGTWAAFTVPTGAIAADGSYTFALTATNTNSAYYTSRTGPNKPVLELTLGSASPPPPPPPPASPVAAFTATPSSGSAPLTVSVTDASTGTPTTWAWDFGDGTGSGLAAPLPHLYTTAGTFIIQLRVANANGTSSTTQSITVSAPPPPPPPATRVAGLTFESQRLVDPANGASKTSGAVSLETGQPLVGVASARVANSTAAYVERSWTATDDVYVSAVIRFAALPTAAVRILQLSDAGTTIGNLQLQPNGALRLRKDSSVLGADSAPLSPGVTYRIAIHQKRGTGSNAILEGYVAPVAATLAAPFASAANGTWITAADRLRIGATAGAVIDLTLDDVFVDVGALGATTAAIRLPNATPSDPSAAAAAARVLFVCLLS
jgi:PKD repeat protein